MEKFCLFSQNDSLIYVVLWSEHQRCPAAGFNRIFMLMFIADSYREAVVKLCATMQIPIWKQITPNHPDRKTFDWRFYSPLFAFQPHEVGAGHSFRLR